MVRNLWRTVIKTIHFHRAGGHLAAHVAAPVVDAAADGQEKAPAEGTVQGPAAAQGGAAAAEPVVLPHLGYNVSVATFEEGQSFSGR